MSQSRVFSGWLWVAVALVLSWTLVVGQRPASASVTAVSGSAFGYYTNVGLFGGPATVRPCTNPPTNTVGCAAAPAVTLPVGGSAVPITRDLDRSKPKTSNFVAGTAMVDPLSVVPAISPRTSVYRITGELTDGPDFKIKLFQDFVVTFAGGAVMRAFFLNPGGEFPQQLERGLLTKVIGRI